MQYDNLVVEIDVQKHPAMARRGMVEADAVRECGS